MSEPQHPFGTDGTETNAGRSAPSGAPSPVQAVPETLGAVGARLAQLREAKGWSVEDVSARLKVAVSKLRELEAGDISHLPDATFAMGVVRAYAKLLGADPAPFTQALRRERGEAQQDLSMPASAGADLPRGRVSLSLGGSGVRAPRRRASWLWGVAIVVIAVVLIGMWHTNSGDSSAWFARIKSMANGVGSSTASGDSAASSATVAEGQTAGQTAGASDAQNEEQATQAAAAANDQAGTTDQNTASAPQAAQVAPAAPASATPAANTAVAPKVASAAAQTQAQVAASAPAAAQGASAPVAAAGDTSTFAIRVTQDTWVSVRQKDGKEVFSGLVHGSDAREITGVGPLKVTVGNKAGIESMTIDGQPVDAAKYASARGNVARFVLP